MVLELQLPKVIHIVQRDDPATGGAVRVAFELVRRLAQYNFTSRMLFLYGDKGYYGERLPKQCDYLRIRNSADVTRLARLRDYIKREDPDVVHFHDDLLWPQLMMPKDHRSIYVTHAHGGGTSPPQPWKTRFLYACQRKNSRAVVCITDEARLGQVRNAGFSPRLTYVVRNGVDFAHFAPPSIEQKHKARASLRVSVEAPTIGFVGRLHDEMKGCYDFLRLLDKLPASWFGVVAGTGPDAETMHLEAEKLNLTTRIRFAGLLNDPLAAYWAMDVFCFTSRYEPFGLTVAEAMGCAIPVVGFSCPGGSQELLTNQTGSVIEGRDLCAMADAVQLAFLRQPPWPERIAEATRTIRNKYDWDASARNLVGIYNRLLQPTLLDGIAI